MSTRKIWRAQEDQILRMLFEVEGIKKWSKIAQIMKKQYDIPDSNGKKCRERYHNHLNPDLNKSQWTTEEEKTLIQLHNRMGNRWATIAKQLDGRTDNSVKNKFYSMMRRSLRTINAMSNAIAKRSKELKMNFVYKLIQIIEAKKYSNSFLKLDLLNLAEEIKRKMLEFDKVPSELSDSKIQDFKLFLKNIEEINKAYLKKKRSKKVKRQDSNSQELSSNEENFVYKIRTQIQNQQQIIQNVLHKKNDQKGVSTSKHPVKKQEDDYTNTYLYNSDLILFKHQQIKTQTTAFETIGEPTEIKNENPYELNEILPYQDYACFDFHLMKHEDHQFSQNFRGLFSF